MTSPLIAGYMACLHRSSPRPADEAADGLAETYQHHLPPGPENRNPRRPRWPSSGTWRRSSASSPARRRAGEPPGCCWHRPVAGGCWAAALILGRAWTWPVPAIAGSASPPPCCWRSWRLLAAATSQHSYQRTRLAMLASPVILLLDATAVTAAALAAPAFAPPLSAAVAVSLGRIAFTARTLPRLAAR